MKILSLTQFLAKIFFAFSFSVISISIAQAKPENVDVANIPELTSEKIADIKAEEEASSAAMTAQDAENAAGQAHEAAKGHNGNGYSPVSVVIFDTFHHNAHYPGRSHGAFVSQIAQGLHHQILDVPSSVEFHHVTLNRRTYPTPHYTTPIYNRSFSTPFYSSRTLRDIFQIQALATPPLVITSAGNTSNECTPFAAQVGRTRGLSAARLRSHPQIDDLYKACDMHVVAAIDHDADDNWIVVGPSYSRGQKPGTVLMHRWVNAPYHHQVNGRNYQGTSYGAPYVSALAAEIIARVPGITAQQVANIIFETATDMGEPGVDRVWGHGIVNPKAIRQRLSEMGY